MMDSIVFTNVSIFRAIADDAHEQMCELMSAARRPNPTGGWIITYDPKSASFKQACIAIVFAGVWLEAAAHLAIVREHGIDQAKLYDRRSYEDKLRFLGLSEEQVIDRAKRLRVARRELVHEKAHMDAGEIRRAQDEAESAHELLVALRGRM
jgi:hypothetical protein